MTHRAAPLLAEQVDGYQLKLATGRDDEWIQSDTVVEVKA